jgi:hypothetical protein
VPLRERIRGLYLTRIERIRKLCQTLATAYHDFRATTWRGKLQEQRQLVERKRKRREALLEGSRPLGQSVEEGLGELASGCLATLFGLAVIAFLVLVFLALIRYVFS